MRKTQNKRGSVTVTVTALPLVAGTPTLLAARGNTTPTPGSQSRSHAYLYCVLPPRKFNQCDCRYLLSRSKAISLGLSRCELIKIVWLLPSRSDTDMVFCVVSVQYSCDDLQSTASPLQSLMPVIIVVVFAVSMWKRLMFWSITSLQNM